MGDWDDDEWEAPTLADAKDAPESWSDEEGHDAHKISEPGVSMQNLGFMHGVILNVSLS